MNVLKEPQVQECLSAAFNGIVPKDLSEENLNKELSIYGAASGKGSVITPSNELVLNQLAHKMRKVVESLGESNA